MPVSHSVPNRRTTCSADLHLLEGATITIEDRLDVVDRNPEPIVKHAAEICRETDLPELFALFADWYKFNPRMRERDFFDWQFRDTPLRLSSGEYDFLVLRDGTGRIVGGLGMVGFQFRLGDRFDIGGWTHNWHAEGQANSGLRLFGRFTELVDNRFLLRLNETSAGIVHMLRIPFLPAMPRWWAVIDADRAADLFGMTEADRSILQSSADSFLRAHTRAVAQQVPRLDPEEEFQLAHLEGITGHVRRTGHYLNWRYVDIPRHDYKLIRTERGLGVYRLETIMGTDNTSVRLLEWTFAPEETCGALATVIADAAPRNPILIDFHCTNRGCGDALIPFGFVPAGATQARMPDLFRPTYHSGGYAVAIDLPPHRTQRALDFNSWYITIGDSDIDRVKL